ncbi:MAG: PP2C family protein-serine/threonine phosphatase, partial [Candidatus Binataceae bacterium]
MEFGARSDMGRVRSNNEDALTLAPELNLFVLCDGMGGYACGEVASRLAVDTIAAHCGEAASNPSLPLFGPAISGVSSAANRLASAVRLANRAIYEASQKNSTSADGAHNPSSAGRMGSTVVAALFNDECMSLVHVGDSRAYRLRSGAFEPLTEDHSFVAEQVRLGRMTREEAARSTMQSVLLRALGTEPEVDVDADDELLADGDAILLCSDGLTRELSDAQIAAVLEETSDPQQAADRLVGLANEAGGGDNVSVIVLRQ